MIKRVSLFTSKRDFLLFLATCSFILLHSLYIEYKNYQELTRFDSYIIKATVLKQYEKSKNSRTYQVLKLKSESGLIFYTGAKKSLPDLKNKKLELEIWAGGISFYEYLTHFYAYSKIQHIYESSTLKHRINTSISNSHKNEEIADIYRALYTATPLNRELQTTFSTLGVSHLLAISGFHLGVLSALLYFLFKPVYTLAQDSFFPYRSSKLDIFLSVATLLFAYLLFLDFPPSLLRAYTMLIFGFVLYDRGIKIVSMWTLFLTIILLLVFFPRLLFSLGFWLSVSGVFYIFLFLIHFKHLKKVWQFILVPFWVYILMLPFSLVIFGNFSIYHPLSVLWTTLFTLFYPLSILMHSINHGDIFDKLLENLIELGQNGVQITLSSKLLLIHVTLSLLSILKKTLLYLLLCFSLSIFIYAVYHIT